MPVLGCGAEMAKLMDVSDQDVAIIEDTIAERLALGISQAQAQRQAVDEALAQLADERAMVMAAVDGQLKVEEPVINEPVTKSNDVVGNQGGRSADDTTPGPVYKDNMPPERDGFKRLYHGSFGNAKTGKDFDTVPSGGPFDGFFASGSEQSSWGAHGSGTKYFADVPEDKILTDYELNYHIPYEESLAAFEKATGITAEDDEFDAAWAAVIGDLKGDQEANAEAAGLTDSVLDTPGLVAQKLRGRVAKELGFQAIEMWDEHGTTWLMVPGTPLTRVHDRNESTAPDSGGAQFSNKSQTDTPEFKKWFGASAVVDADGKPLVVYKGDNAAPDTFKDGANFFTSSERMAKGYGDKVRAFYVSIKNPASYDDVISAAQAVGWSKNALEDEIPRVVLGQDDRVVARLKQQGFDGWIGEDDPQMDDYDNIEPQPTYVTFSPTQIKSAIGNNGQFDGTNPDIRFANRSTGAVFDRDVAGRLELALPRQIAQSLPGQVVSKILDRIYLKNASPEIRHATRAMKLDIQKSIDVAGELAQEVNKLSADEREMVSDLIEGELKAGVIPPQHIVKMAAMFNEAFRTQTDELVRLDMMPQDAADRWRDKYLPRYYASKLKGNVEETWASLVGNLDQGRKFSQGIKGKHLMGRGMVNTIPVSELQDWEGKGWEIRDKSYDPATSAEVQVWRDFTKAEREKMQEIRDAGFRFVMGYMQTQKDIALGRMYERLSTDPRFSSNTEKQGWVEVPTTKIKGTAGTSLYGKLAGKFVPRELMSQLSTEKELTSDAFKMYKKALAWWKSNKTVMNPVAHMNNFVSNTSMAHLAGVSYYDEHKYAGAIRDLATSAPMVKEARDAGLFLGSLTDEELQKVLPPELRALLGKTDSAGVKALKVVDAMLTFGLRGKMGQAYEFGDKFFKYLLYADARKRGATAEEAVDHAQRHIFTYDELPLMARRIRDLGVPFFAYTYKAVPALAHAALARPDRFLLPAGIVFMANAVGYAVLAGGGGEDDSWLEAAKKYLTDSEFRDKVEAKKEEEYKLLPEWMKGRTAFGARKTIRLHTDKDSGNPVFLDISRFIPGGDLADINSNTGGIPWLQPITPSNPLLSMYSAMFDNKDPFFGKDLVNKSDDAWEATGKRANYLWKLATPAISVGNGLWDKAIGVAASLHGDEIPYVPDIVGGGNTGLDRQGTPIQAKYTVPSMVGVKARPIDLDMNEKFDKYNTNKLIEEIRTGVRKAKSNNTFSPRLLEKMEERAQIKIDRLREGLTVDGNTKD